MEHFIIFLLRKVSMAFSERRRQMILVERMDCLEKEGLIDITIGGDYGNFATILKELYQSLKEVLGEHVSEEGPEWWGWKQVLGRC